METTRACAVSNPAVALGSRSGTKRQVPFIAYREMWPEGFDFHKLRRVADCILFYLQATGSAAYPAIIWERSEGFDIRWAKGQAPAELTGKTTTLAGTSFKVRESEGRLRVA
jgi:hypothetical protein